VHVLQSLIVTQEAEQSVTAVEPVVTVPQVVVVVVGRQRAVVVPPPLVRRQSLQPEVVKQESQFSPKQVQLLPPTGKAVPAQAPADEHRWPFVVTHQTQPAAHVSQVAPLHWP